MSIRSHFPKLTTERLLLREIEFTDSHAIYQIFSDEEVMKWYGVFPIENMEAALRLIENLRMNYYENRGIRWAIIEKNTNRLIGTCGFHNWNVNSRRAEIGYELGREFWHCGYASEAIREMIHFGCDVMNLQRVEALVYPENIASQTTLEKLDFSKEGLLKGYAYFRNTYQDLIMYSWINAQHVRNL